MKQAHKSTSDLDAIKRCFEAYGADIKRWPADAREKYGELALADEMASIRSEAEQLDSFLGAATAPSMSPDLKNRIIAQYQPPQQRTEFAEIIDNLFGGRRLIPAGAMAGIGALGVFAGSITANTSVALSPEAEAYAYAYEDVDVSLTLDDEEAS